MRHSGIVALVALAACAPKPSPSPAAPAAPGAAALSAAPARAVAQTPRARVPAALYPPTGCLPPKPASKKSPVVFEPLPCDDAKRARDAWLDELEKTGRIPHTVPAGAAEGTLGKIVVGRRVRLSASGALGSLVLDVAPDGTAQRVVLGAFDAMPPSFGPDSIVAKLLLPSGWVVTDVVDRDAKVGARIGGWGTLREGGVFVTGSGTRAPDVDAPVVAALPPAGLEATIPDDTMATFDPDAQALRSWSFTEAEAIAFEQNGARVVRGGSGSAIVVRDGKSCHGHWLDARSKDAARPICDAIPRQDGGVRMVRATPLGQTEVVDVDAKGAEKAIASLPARPWTVELVGSPDDQLAWLVAKRLHVREVASRSELDVADALPCRSGEEACRLDHARLLRTGAALVHVSTSFDATLHLVTPRGWVATPMKSTQQKDVVCIVEDLTTAADATTALVHCPGDTPEWHLRTIASDGAISDATAPELQVTLANLVHEPPATLKLGGERVCASDGLVYQGPACDTLVHGKRRK